MLTVSVCLLVVTLENVSRGYPEPIDAALHCIHNSRPHDQWHWQTLKNNLIYVVNTYIFVISKVANTFRGIS
jgi:hypothetical protein